VSESVCLSVCACVRDRQKDKDYETKTEKGFRDREGREKEDLETYREREKGI